MERKTLTQHISLAAGTAGRVYFAPPTATGRYKLVSVAELPNAAVAADPTDYVTRSLIKGSATALNVPVTTATVAVVQGTAVPAVITGVGLDLEITQASPLSYRVAQAASGKAIDMSVVVEFEVERV